MKKLIYTIAAVTAVLAAIFVIRATSPYHKLMGDTHLHLVCDFSDGYREVPKSKIIALDDESGYWVFSNGSAKDCTIEDDRVSGY